MCSWANDTRANFAGFYIFARDNLRRPAQWPLAHRLQHRATPTRTTPATWCFIYTSNFHRPLGFPYLSRIQLVRKFVGWKQADKQSPTLVATSPDSGNWIVICDLFPLKKTYFKEQSQLRRQKYFLLVKFCPVCRLLCYLFVTLIVILMNSDLKVNFWKPACEMSKHPMPFSFWCVGFFKQIVS
jgi:hypothetical protein